jgi:hypothetical protein
MNAKTLENLDIYDPDNYVDAVPLADFKTLRDKAPVYWHSHPDGGNKPASRCDEGVP